MSINISINININSIHLDILKHILQICIDVKDVKDAPNTTYKLMHVCRLWRTIIANMSIIWHEFIDRYMIDSSEIVGRYIGISHINYVEPKSDDFARLVNSCRIQCEFKSLQRMEHEVLESDGIKKILCGAIEPANSTRVTMKKLIYCTEVLRINTRRLFVIYADNKTSRSPIIGISVLYGRMIPGCVVELAGAMFANIDPYLRNDKIYVLIYDSVIYIKKNGYLCDWMRLSPRGAFKLGFYTWGNAVEFKKKSD